MKLKILILASLLLLVNQVNALSIGGGNIFTVDWFVGLNLAGNGIELSSSGDGIKGVEPFDSLILIVNKEPVIDEVFIPVERLTADGPLPLRCFDGDCATVAEPGVIGLLAIGLLAMVAGSRRFNL